MLLCIPNFASDNIRLPKFILKLFSLILLYNYKFISIVLLSSEVRNLKYFNSDIYSTIILSNVS
jgi:hypothetical protein